MRFLVVGALCHYHCIIKAEVERTDGRYCVVKVDQELIDLECRVFAVNQ